jgi:cell wall-associated NlpC family hydrolase
LSAERISQAETATAAAFVATAITRPYREGAQGPDAFDCWGLVRAAYACLAGRELPLVAIDPKDTRAIIRLALSHPERAAFVQAAKPRHLDIVFMSHCKQPHHFGVFLQVDGGGVLHAVEQSRADKPGVTFDTVLALKMSGWAAFQYWRPGMAS